MKRILITGGSGFIGSHTCLVYLEKGYEVFVIDSNINSSPISLDKIKDILHLKGINCKNRLHFYKGDLRNKQFLEKIFHSAAKEGKPINGVVHLAGLKSVSESNKFSLMYWDNNLTGTINLLMTMDKFSCNTLIFSSSATIYQNSNSNYLDEKSKIKPINPYGNTKFAIEMLLEDIFKNNKRKWKISCLRYFNPIGAHPSGIIGESPLCTPNNIFPILLNVANKEIKKLDIFGNDWPTKDGTPVRDYIHIMDLADSHLIAYEFLQKNEPQMLKLNIGTAIGTSVLELINVFKRVNNIDIPYQYSKRRKGDNGYVVANNKLAKTIFDWEPKRNICEMCQDGWNWKKKNLKGF
jgi:UDP-glucose 4-epimerase